MENFTEEEWFTLDDIAVSNSAEELYCIAVDAPEKQFLIGENMAVPTHNTDEAKAEDELKGEAALIIGSIARLGRAAGVHLVIATQRPDAKIIAGETRENLATRVNCGRTTPTASSMILNNSEGNRVKGNPRGRMYVQTGGNGHHGQGFYADQEWIDNWLNKQGLDLDGTPLEGFVPESSDETADTENNESNSGDNDTSIVPKKKESKVNPEVERQVKNGERPELQGNTPDEKDKFHRPEDDWDNDMDELSALNDD